MITYVSARLADAYRFQGLSVEGRPVPTEEEIEAQLREDLARLREYFESRQRDPDELIRELQGDIREAAGLDREFEPKIDFGN